MDEATSALDAATEHNMIEKPGRRECIQIIVAHRRSTIRDAGLILSLDRGQVIQQGHHSTMIRDPDSPYIRLLQKSTWSRKKC